MNLRGPIDNARGFLRRHPLLRDAILWAIPALVFGAALRLVLLSYSPLAYWGSDSRSYFGFPHGVLSEFYFSLNEKRRYLYPVFLLPVCMLPGTPLQWLAWIQAALGLAAILPLAYTVRKVFFAWKLWILPATVLYAGLPVFLWYEHELLAETIFFGALVWACGGWAAWTAQKDPARARRLWWWFFVPLAIAMLTKPSGRFLWPGLLLGLLLVGAWRVLKKPQVISAGALFLATLTMGDDGQAAWLLYTSAFPLTRLETPLHATYKAEIRDMVEYSRTHLDSYANEDGEAFLFLRNPRNQTQRPLWQSLGTDEKKLAKVYKDMALEAIKADPWHFAYISLQRLVGSANPAKFKDDRFEATYFGERFQKAYLLKRNSEGMIRLAFNVPKKQPLPSADYFRQRASPNPDSALAPALQNYVRRYQSAGELVKDGPNKNAAINGARPSLLGWLLIVGLCTSLLSPYRRSIGVWTVTMAIYLFGVFLVGVLHPRYFAPVWPVFILCLPLAADAVLRAWYNRASRLKAPA